MIIVAVVAALIGIAAAYHAYATWRDHRKYTPPGKLVDAGGFRLHLYPMGDPAARPTVLLDAGMVSFSSNWAWVQPEIAKVTLAVAYDRAGLGWSEPSPNPRDAQTSARELHTALHNAEIGGPYVGVGHSFGGLTMRAFADLYPDEVVGLVLVDASHPDQWAHIPASRGGRINATAQRAMSRVGYLGLFRLMKREADMLAAGLPPRQYAEITAFSMLPSALAVSADALSIWDSMTRPQINRGMGYGGKPLIVLSVTEQAMYADVLTKLQNELPSLSTNSRHITVQGATHENLVSNPQFARYVTDAILEVVNAVRGGQSLSPMSAAPGTA